MDNTSGTSLVSVGEYLEFPDIPFFDSESRSVKVGRNTYVSSTLVKFIQDKSGQLFDTYKNLQTEQEAGDLYEDIILFIIGKGWNESFRLGDPKTLLKAKLMFQDIYSSNKQKKLHQNKQENSTVSDLDALIEYLERVLDDIAERFQFNDTEKKNRYLGMKKQILESGVKQSQEREVPNIVIPDHPAISQNTLPQNQRAFVASKIGKVLKIGTDWKELRSQYNNFFSNFQEICTIFLQEDIHLHNNISHAERFLQEKFDELYEKNSFPRGFTFSTSEIHFGTGQMHVTQEVYDEETRTFSDQKIKLPDYYGPYIRVNINFDMLEDLPDWIQSSYGLYEREISHTLYLDDDRRKCGLNSDFSKFLGSITTLGEVAKYRKDIQKHYESIQNDPILETLLSKIWERGDFSGDVGLLQLNIESITQIWENRENLKQAVGWIGLKNVEEIILNTSYKNLDDIFEGLQKKFYSYLPIPGYIAIGGIKLKDVVIEDIRKKLKSSKYVYYVMDGSKIKYAIGYEGYSYDKSTFVRPIIYSREEDKILPYTEASKILTEEFKHKNFQNDDFAKLFLDLSYYFTSKKSDEFETKAYGANKFIMKCIEGKLKGKVVILSEVNGRLKISIFKDGEEINDLNNQAEAQKIIWKALQKVEKTSESGKKK